MLFGKLKLYALAALAGIAAIGLYTLRIVTMTKSNVKAEDNERRLTAIHDKKEIEEDVKDNDDDALINGILRKDR